VRYIVLSEIGSSIDTLYLIIDLLVHHGFRTVSDILELKPTELSQGIFTRRCISYNFIFIARAWCKFYSGFGNTFRSSGFW